MKRTIELGKEQVSMMNPPNEGILRDRQGRDWKIGRTGDGRIMLRSNESHPDFLPSGMDLETFCQWIKKRRCCNPSTPYQGGDRLNCVLPVGHKGPHQSEVVFYEDFGTIPDEMKSGPREQIIAGAQTLDHWLVAWSESPFGT